MATKKKPAAKKAVTPKKKAPPAIKKAKAAVKKPAAAKKAAPASQAPAAKSPAAALKPKTTSRPVKKNEKFLVTGACGLTGSHTCELLHERGIPYRATDLAGADTTVLPAGAEFIPGDMTDPESLKPVVAGIDVILHPAAIFDWSTPRDVLEAVNVRGTENLCVAAKDAGVRRLVSWSTAGVYGRQKFEVLPIREDYPKRPVEDYSITKYMEDQVVLRFNGEGGLTTSVIRPGLVYGPRSHYGAGQLFEILAVMPAVPVPVNFTYRIGVVHVRDIASAAIFVAGKPEAAGEEYACVDCSGITIADFFRLVARTMEKPTVPVYIQPSFARKAGLMAADISEWFAQNVTHTHPFIERGPIQSFPVDLYISNRKLLDLGYEFEYPTPERGIEEYIAWMREEGLLEMNVIDLFKKFSRI